MLLVKKTHLDRARTAQSAAEIIGLLYGGIQLELSTIPPYLTGVFSLQAGANDEVRSLVQSVVVEEMLHLSLAANTAIALGGHPAIKALALENHYPGPLPMSVDEGLVVSLGALTVKQVKDVFMAIERPDTTAVLPGEDPEVARSLAALKPQGYGSIGDFYNALIEAIERLCKTGKNPFANPRLDRQLDLSRWFPANVPGYPSGKVDSLESARAALETITRQGEGVNIGHDPIDPFGGGTTLAHYFKFGEIAFGRRLVRDKPASPVLDNPAPHSSGWSYSGDPVPYDATKVYPFLANAKLSDYPVSSPAHRTATACYDAYLRLLTALDATFSGDPSMFNAALGVMFELKLVAQQVVQWPVTKGTTSPVAAPPFQP
jgi:hypothetical protein